MNFKLLLVSIVSIVISIILFYITLIQKQIRLKLPLFVLNQISSTDGVGSSVPVISSSRRPFSRSSSKGNSTTGGGVSRDTSRPPSAFENQMDYFREPVVKSPPEPTRVKSPTEGMVRSPDPINWTVPLDTGKTFSVTQSVRDGGNVLFNVNRHIVKIILGIIYRHHKCSIIIYTTTLLFIRFAS